MNTERRRGGVTRTARLLSIGIALTAQIAAAQSNGDAFVRVDGTRFTVEGRPLHFAGTNCYYLMVFSADPGLRGHVDEVLTEAAAMGVTVVRTWAFNDGSGWNALQTSPGVYQEYVFQGLDYVLDRCRQLGLRVVLPLVNNWADYGGMDQYVAWSSGANDHDDFYTDASCRNWYRAHASAVIGRVNSFNGRMYRDDPTILGWELANEPRCPSDRSGDTLVAWIDEMSEHIRGLDANHLIGTGIEGFYDENSGPWYMSGWEGVDFIRDHQPAAIDFAGAHSWPDNWGLDVPAALSLLSRQVRDATDILGKPFVLGEFGKHRDAEPAQGTAARDAFFAAVYDSLLTAECTGSMFWISYHDAYPDYDGYGTYFPADTSTISIVMAHAEAMGALGSLAAPTGGGEELAGVRLGFSGPSPFVGSTRIALAVPAAAASQPVRLDIADAAGRRFRRILDGTPAAGTQIYTWDARDDAGRRVAAGVYFWVFSHEGSSLSRRAVLLR
jgi:mannan endo-1,4-beta-mannosidase